MKKIKKGIVFSNDIKRILEGYNAFDYNYDVVLNDNVIDDVRKYFRLCVDMIFGDVTIILEDEMLEVNNLIKGDYPHCYVR